MYILTSKYFPTDSWPDLYFPALPEGADIQYREVVEFSLAAVLSAEFAVVLPNDEFINVTGTDIIVSGAGSTATNGTYTVYGDRDGKTRYRMASAESPTGYFYIVSYANAWYISIRGEDGDVGIQIIIASRYHSTDNVATPDLVTTWLVDQGTLPVPTVSDTIPTLTEVAAFTVEMPIVISMEVYEELSA